LEAEIPEDVKRLANEAVYGDGGWHKVGEVEAVARAIMAERERCALVVETDVHLDEYLPSAAIRLAELIRKGA
jgi:hypothetical protein